MWIMLSIEINQHVYYILCKEKLCRKLIKTKFEHKWTSYKMSYKISN